MKGISLDLRASIHKVQIRPSVHLVSANPPPAVRLDSANPLCATHQIALTHTPLLTLVHLPCWLRSLKTCPYAPYSLASLAQETCPCT